MKFFKKLFKPEQPPELRIEIEDVGELEWDKESEYWVGTHNGIKFSVAYDGLSRPGEELSSLVVHTLANPDFPQNFMRKIKELAKSQYTAERHDEIDALVPQDVVFQSPSFILIQFFGPKDSEPFWFAEIHENEKIYVGFDT